MPALIIYESNGQQCLDVTDMCELVPNRGWGNRDIIRIYYNHILQQCLPFSWSGMGGNANRFVSVKNCYEICHPSDPSRRRMTESAVRPVLVVEKPPKGYDPKCDKKENESKDKKMDNPKGKDVIFRQMKH